jgi:hypothetical protein
MAVEGESSKEVPMQFELFEGKWRCQRIYHLVI